MIQSNNVDQVDTIIIGKSEVIKLTADEWDRAIETLNNPPEPSEKMTALFKRGYKTMTDKPTNTKPVTIKLDGEEGKRVILNSARRIIKEHSKEIKALADK